MDVSTPTLKIEPASHSGTTTERSFGFYRQAVLKNLDPEIFRPNRKRLISYFFYLALGLSLVAALVLLGLAWPVQLLCGIVIGVCTGLLGLLVHEISHGTVVKNPRLQYWLSFFGMQPFFITPTFWTASHNRLHHGKTQRLIEDPDAFPNLRIFKHSKFLQSVYSFTPGSGYKRSYLYFGFWMTFNYLVAQFYFRYRNRIYDSIDHRAVNLELAGQILIAIGFLAITGPALWLWVFVIPTLVQNYLVMSYISTNHNLSPLTSENNPLVNSLTVTNHPLFEVLHFNFGYHVEHHLFPNVNPKHAKRIHHELKTQFPADYKYMPKWKALRALYSSPRIYKNANTLVHPETGETVPTL